MLRRTAKDAVPARYHAEQRGFKFSLPLTVEGPDIDGSLFREETTLAYMSHAAAVFPLQSPVSPGTRLKIALTLPPRLSEGRSLRLVVKGTIVLIDPRGPAGRPPRVSLKLENRYAVEAGEACPA